MGTITQREIIDYVEKNIIQFHNKRLEKLEQLQTLLKIKIPISSKPKISIPHKIMSKIFWIRFYLHKKKAFWDYF